MVSVTTYRCDRCDKIIEDTRQVLNLSYGMLGKASEKAQFDLCPDCDNEFRAWITACGLGEMLPEPPKYSGCGE
jgi:hypothetical protein